MKTLVLGLGNELYGDDGIGIHVVRRLKDEIKSGNKASKGFKNVEFMECSLSGLSLLDVIVGYDTLIIIDTIKKSNPSTGRIHLMEDKELRYVPGPSPHYVSIPQSIEIGKQIGLKVPSKINIIAVEAKDMYNLGEGLSEEMAAALPRITQKLKGLLSKMSKSSARSAKEKI